MKNPLAMLVVIFVALGAYALFRAQIAAHRGEVMWSFILLVMAVVFWTRARKIS